MQQAARCLRTPSAHALQQVRGGRQQLAHDG